jgi:hypothetical protein
MNKTRLRIPPSGPFAGDPGLRVGPGSTGIIARAHGVATAAHSSEVATSTATVYIIPGLGDTQSATIPPFLVDMEPGQLYQIETHNYFELLEGVTTNVTVDMYYRLRDTSATTFGAWAKLTQEPIRLLGSNLTTDGNAAANVADCLFGLSVSTPKAEIQIGAVASDGSVWNWPGRSYAIVTEYLPPEPIV